MEDNANESTTLWTPFIAGAIDGNWNDTFGQIEAEPWKRCSVRAYLVTIFSWICLIAGVPKVKDGLVALYRRKYNMKHYESDPPCFLLLATCGFSCLFLSSFNVFAVIIGVESDVKYAALSDAHCYFWMTIHSIVSVETACVGIDRFYQMRHALFRVSKNRMISRKYTYLSGPVPAVIAVAAITIAFIIDYVQGNLRYLEAPFVCDSPESHRSTTSVSRIMQLAIVLCCMVVTPTVYILCICRVWRLTRRTEPSVEGQILGDALPLGARNSERAVSSLVMNQQPRGSNAGSTFSRLTAQRLLSSNDTLTHSGLPREAWGLEKAAKVLGMGDSVSRPGSAFSQYASPLFGPVRTRLDNNRIMSMQSDASSMGDTFRAHRASTVGSCISKDIITARMLAVEKARNARQKSLANLLRPAANGGLEMPGGFEQEQRSTLRSDSLNSSASTRVPRSPCTSRMMSTRGESDSDSCFEHALVTKEMSCQTDPDPGEARVIGPTPEPPASPSPGGPGATSPTPLPISVSHSTTSSDEKASEQQEDVVADRKYCPPTVENMRKKNRLSEASLTPHDQKWSITAEPSYIHLAEGSCSPGDITFDNMDTAHGYADRYPKIVEDEDEVPPGKEPDKATATVEDAGDKQPVSAPPSPRRPETKPAPKMFPRKLIPREPVIVDHNRQRARNFDRIISKDADPAAYYNKLARRGTITDFSDMSMVREPLVRRDSFPPSSQPSRPAIRVMKASIDTIGTNHNTVYPTFLNSPRRMHGDQLAFSDISGSASTNNSNCSDSASTKRENNSSSFNRRVRSRLNNLARIASHDSFYLSPISPARLHEEPEPRNDISAYTIILKNSIMKTVVFLACYLFSCIFYLIQSQERTPTVNRLYVAAECISMLYFTLVLYIYHPNVNLESPVNNIGGSFTPGRLSNNRQTTDIRSRANSER